MSVRKELDDYMSIHCFKAAIVGMEDILGVEGTASALIAAGRQRGINLAESLDLKGKNPDTSTLVKTLSDALGCNGTRLCEISEITDTPEGGFYIKAKETVCTAGEAQGSGRKCTYTMGAVMGFMETVSGKTLTGKHAASVLDGSATDDFLFEPIS